MATSNKTIADKLTSLEGKLNTFGTLINDRHPEYKATLDAVYKDLDELKSLAGVKDTAAPTGEKTPT